MEITRIRPVLRVADECVVAWSCRVTVTVNGSTCGPSVMQMPVVPKLLAEWSQREVSTALAHYARSEWTESDERGGSRLVLPRMEEIAYQRSLTRELPDFDLGSLKP